MNFFSRAIYLVALVTSSAIAQQDSIQVAVKTAIVNYHPVNVPVLSSGVLQHKTEQPLSFKVSGIIDKIHVDEGDFVSQGQLLASLDKAEINAKVKQAVAVEKNAQANLRRLKKLFSQKLISDDRLQQAETQLEVAKADLSIAQFNAKHAEIRAPHDGQILRRLVEQKQSVNVYQPVLKVSSNNTGWIVRVGLSDKDIVKIAMGGSAAITFDAYPNQQFTAQISEIAGAANTRTRLFEVELALTATDKPLYSGFIGRVEIASSQSQSLAKLPVQALVTARGSQAQVYIVSNEKKVQKKQVEVAFMQDDSLVIKGGLSEGQRVITLGSAYVQPGQVVTLR